jgi:hypothetical protein
MSLIGGNPSITDLGARIAREGFDRTAAAVAQHGNHSPQARAAALDTCSRLNTALGLGTTPEQIAATKH